MTERTSPPGNRTGRSTLVNGGRRERALPLTGFWTQPLRLPKWPRRPRRTLAPVASELSPVLVLDLRNHDFSRVQHRHVLRLCDSVKTRICLIVVCREHLTCDVWIHPDTLDMKVHYAGVMLTHPEWKDQQMLNLLLPGDAGLKLAVLNAIHIFNEDNASKVFQVAPAPMVPGVPCIALTALEQTLRTLDPTNRV